MEQCPEAVLCQVHTALFIEGHEEMLCVASLDSFEGMSGLAERYRETLEAFPGDGQFTVYIAHRPCAGRRCTGKVIATDLAFIQELSIQGEFVQGSKGPFHLLWPGKMEYRPSGLPGFFGNAKKPWWYLPFVVLFCNHWKRVARAAIPFRCEASLVGDFD